jgi:hypothetical protein
LSSSCLGLVRAAELPSLELAAPHPTVGVAVSVGKYARLANRVLALAPSFPNGISEHHF